MLDTGGCELLVAASDPITFASGHLGRDLLAVNENDLVTMGARPRWLLATVLLPEGVDSQTSQQILDGLVDAASVHDVALVGGHTEITPSVDRPLAIGCLLGTVPRDGVLCTSGAGIGDAIILAGGLAIEGTAILASEYSSALAARGIDPEVVAAAVRLRDQPGISIRRSAEILLEDRSSVHALHDPTEGGLATALYELAEAAQVGLSIDLAAVDIRAESAVVCNALGLDPLGLLASGALIATMDPTSMRGALNRLSEQGIPAACIGHVVCQISGQTMKSDGKVRPIPRFARDELARFIESL